MMQDSLDTAESMSKNNVPVITGGLQYIQDGPSPPAPINYAEFELEDEDTIAKRTMEQRAREIMPPQPTAAAVVPGRDTIYDPAVEDMDDIRGNINTGAGINNRRGWGDIEVRNDTVQQPNGRCVGSTDIESQSLRSQNIVEDEGNSSSISSTSSEEDAGSIHGVTEAYPVDDTSIILRASVNGITHICSSRFSYYTKVHKDKECKKRSRNRTGVISVLSYDFVGVI